MRLDSQCICRDIGACCGVCALSAGGACGVGGWVSMSGARYLYRAVQFWATGAAAGQGLLSVNS
jgi:hypothetical protein